MPTGGVYLHLYAADLGPISRWALVGAGRQDADAEAEPATRWRTGRWSPDSGRRLQGRQRPARWRPSSPRSARCWSALAPAKTRDPRIVLLTPGPYNETYFEHAYLARHLGFTLVEGGDLTVRDRRVFLKTLSGLEPVHVILRRLDDDYCDPLELRVD